MILADTSVWIDHLHRPEARLVTSLGEDEIGCHPLVIARQLGIASIS